MRIFLEGGAKSVLELLSSSIKSNFKINLSSIFFIKSMTKCKQG